MNYLVALACLMLIWSVAAIDPVKIDISDCGTGYESKKQRQLEITIKFSFKFIFIARSRLYS